MPATMEKPQAATAVRPFTYKAPEAELQDLRNRISATRWPEKEAVADDTQGVQLATIQKLARYWATEHDWRKVESKMNSYPQRDSRRLLHPTHTHVEVRRERTWDGRVRDVHRPLHDHLPPRR